MYTFISFYARFAETESFSLSCCHRAFFTVVPTLVNVAFSRGEVSALLMDKYGIDKSRIKIRWRIDLHPRSMGASLRDVFGWFDTNGDGVISNEEYLASQQSVSGERFPRAKKGVDPLVVEGISKYTLDAKGRITMHEIEVTSPTDYAFLEALRELLPGVCVCACARVLCRVDRQTDRQADTMYAP